MKRRNAMLLFGLLTLSVAGYAAWCGRFFCLRPEIVFRRDVPDDARPAIRAWNAKQQYFLPRPFSWRQYWYHLQRPWDGNKMGSIHVSLVDDGTHASVYAHHYSRRAYCMEFRKGEQGWAPFEPVLYNDVMRRELDYRKGRRHRIDPDHFNGPSETAEALSPNF